MSSPFRDDGAALAERVAQLETENRELRARLGEALEAGGINREAFLTRLNEENAELRITVRELREELARLRAQLRPRRGSPTTTLIDWLEGIAALFRKT